MVTSNHREEMGIDCLQRDLELHDSHGRILLGHLLDLCLHGSCAENGRVATRLISSLD